MRMTVITTLTAALLAGTAVGAHAQSGAGPGGAAATGAADVSGRQGGAGPNGGASGGAASNAAQARVGAVQGVTGEAQKPVAGATGPDGAGAVQGAGAVK